MFGQPWVRISGVAFGSLERTWTKWMSCPSISVMNCGYALSRASCSRQSNASRQRSTISLTYATGTPYSQPGGAGTPSILPATSSTGSSSA